MTLSINANTNTRLLRTSGRTICIAIYVTLIIVIMITMTIVMGGDRKSYRKFTYSTSKNMEFEDEENKTYIIRRPTDIVILV